MTEVLRLVVPGIETLFRTLDPACQFDAVTSWTFVEVELYFWKGHPVAVVATVGAATLVSALDSEAVTA